MKSFPFNKLIYFDEFSATPKYQQLANSIVKALESGKLQVDDMLPSINELSHQFEISRDTAEKGYKYLKKIGIIGSVAGKGYYIKKADINRTYRIFLLFNKLSPHKKIIYDALVATLGENAAVDFYIYNNDFALFKKLLLNSKEDEYHYYVIIPHFIDGEESAPRVLNNISKEKLILLDKLIPGMSGNFAAVYQDFEADVYTALKQALPQLSKYRTLKIIFPKNTYYPAEIPKGFISFCQQYGFNHKIVHAIKDEPINEGEVYLTVMDDDLVTLVERIIEQKLQVGKDIGVISYNETPLKKIILQGITTMSTDFEAMGVQTAQLILNDSSTQVAMPFYLTLRPSL